VYMPGYHRWEGGYPVYMPGIHLWEKLLRKEAHFSQRMGKPMGEC